MSRQRCSAIHWKRVVLLFFLGWALIYANRIVFSAVLTEIALEWRLSKTELGLLSSAFFMAYTLGQVPTGFLADKFSKRVLLLPGYYLQGAAAAASGMVGSSAAFLLARVLAGAGQSTYYASQYALAALYVPREKRAQGAAVINAGMAGGVLIGLMAGSIAVFHLGLNWRVPMVVLGVASVALGLCIHLFVAETPRPTGDSRQNDTAMQPKVRQNPLGTRDFWLMWFTALGTQYSLYLVLTWLPFYLQEARGLTGSAAGVASSLMPLLAAPSGIAAGWLSDRFGTRRKILVTLVPCSLVALALIGFSKTYAMLYIGLALYGITGKLTIDPLIVAAVQDISGDQGRASALGVLNFASTVSMVAAPAVTGYLVDVTGSFSSAFWVAILLAGVSSVAVSLTREQRATLREN